jgi:hypothetical protein
MKTLKKVIEDMGHDVLYDDEANLLDEAGNISSAIALKKHHNTINYGRQIVKSRTSTDGEKLLAKMMVEVASLALMAVANSGEGSFLSSVAKGATLRKI